MTHFPFSFHGLAFLSTGVMNGSPFWFSSTHPFSLTRQIHFIFEFFKVRVNFYSQSYFSRVSEVFILSILSWFFIPFRICSSVSFVISFTSVIFYTFQCLRTEINSTEIDCIDNRNIPEVLSLQSPVGNWEVHANHYNIWGNLSISKGHFCNKEAHRSEV